MTSGGAQPYPSSTGLEPEDAKDELRRAIRTAREVRSERLRREAADALADVVESIPEVKDARCVATYAARATEPGTLALMDRLAARDVRVLLPVLGTGLQRNWAEYAGSDDLRVRAPGRPPEPGTPELPAEAVVDADVILVPALAVDTSGMRLGQGGGWYDRVLQHARPDARVVAVVFPEEVYDAGERPLPSEPHDQRVQAVATPAGWRELGV
ncbi:5-formyltetrahydrofolate cyclo-ligase [Luteimicrobium sp. NPDC057192]|uniref:5-formyltetrahydrofolate cyclo-ligase n=1 Tax=Luteimicrobium sp. NPDC057192 TaxID=3346042 RepID=UPI003634E358